MSDATKRGGQVAAVLDPTQTAEELRSLAVASARALLEMCGAAEDAEGAEQAAFASEVLAAHHRARFQTELALL